MNKGQSHSPMFKAKVATRTFIGGKTVQGNAPYQSIHPIKETHWKRRPRDATSELITRTNKNKERKEALSQEDDKKATDTKSFSLFMGIK